MPPADYHPPLDALLTRGSPEDGTAKGWADYVQELGLGPEQIPDLIRMATDHDLRWNDAYKVEYWAPVHAWRALGQLHAQAAIEPLLRLFDEDDDEWAGEDLPEVYAMLGPAAIPALDAFLDATGHSVWAHGKAMRSLTAIAGQHPETHDDVVARLMRHLAGFATGDPEWNGFLIGELGELKATEALPLIEQAFEADRVDTFLIDWEDVQIDFGLKTPEELGRMPLPVPLAPTAAPGAPRVRSGPAPGARPNAAREKSKRQMAKASRKKNRKRK